MECGHAGMAQSHECCQIQTSPADLHALKPSSLPWHHSLVDLDREAADVGVSAVVTPTFVGRIPSTTASPPGLSSVLTTVLRI